MAFVFHVRMLILFFRVRAAAVQSGVSAAAVVVSAAAERGWVSKYQA